MQKYPTAVEWRSTITITEQKEICRWAGNLVWVKSGF